MTPLTTDMATLYAKVPSCLTTRFKHFKMAFSSGQMEIRFLELTNLNENYIN